MENLNRLIENIRRENVVVFIGSGFSLKAGAPSGNKIVETLKEKLSKEEIDSFSGNQLDYVSNEFQQMRNRDELLDIVKTMMNFAPLNLDDQNALATIPHFHEIITTNYDTLLEDVYGDNCYVIRNALDCINIPQDKVLIYKIHGDFSCPEKIIMTKEDYDDFHKNAQNDSFWKLIQSKLLTKDILFIGYSLEDSNMWNIIKDIQSDTEGQKGNVFLAAPSLNKSKINRLIEKNISYLDYRAEDLFPIITNAIKTKICRDFRRKKVSAETFTKFCQLHDINPSIKLNKYENTIEKVETIGTTQQQITFTTDSSKVCDILSKDLNAYNDRLPTSNSLPRNISLIPALSLPSQELNNLSISINGIEIFSKEDITKIYILPRFKEGHTTIRVPDIGFSEKIEYAIYKSNNSAHVVFKEDGFQFELVVSPLKNDGVIINGDVSRTDTYSNTSNVMKWTNFLIALYEGRNLSISGIPKSFSIPQNPEIVDSMKKVLDYYKLISDIENLRNEDFDIYYNYSDKNYLHARIVMSYLTHNAFLEYTPNGFDFEFTVNDYSHNVNKFPCKKNESYVLALPYPNTNPIKLNNEDFNIPYQNILFGDCYVVEMNEDKENDKASFKFHNKESYFQIRGADNPVRQDGDIVHLI